MTTEYLVEMTIAVPDAAPLAELAAQEADRAHELAELGYLLRLWALPSRDGQRRTLGLWRAADVTELTTTLRSLPFYPYMSVSLTPLNAHGNDPAMGVTR